MLTVNSLRKNFGNLRAVDDISLKVNRGEVLGFLGPNGSGKSTTMKMITGSLLPDSGMVEICNLDMLQRPIAAQWHIGYLPEGAPAYEDISVHAYLRFVANVRQLNGRKGKLAIDHAAVRTNISDVLHQPVGTLSKGYKRRVGLAQALLHDPDVLVLDEPTDGLDPNQKHEVRALIQDISADKAIIISTHILEEIDAICDRVVIIANGHVVGNGTPQQLAAKSRYHNAVALTLPEPAADTIQASLQALTTIQTVERRATNANLVELIALSDGGTNILPLVSQQVQEQRWPVQQIKLKSGDLHEVFRALTTSQARIVSLDGVKQDKPVALPISGNTAATAQSCGKSLTCSVKNIWTVCKNELTLYFSTPIAYVFITVFLLAMGSLTFFLGGFFIQGQARLDIFFQFHPWLYLFLVPAIAMRLWAEERRSGFVELLLTLPLTTANMVIGKFLAAWLVVGLALLLTLPMWLTVNYLGSPDNATIAAGYFGSLFTAGGYLAIGSFASALSSNQVTAFIVSATLCFLFTVSGLNLVLEFFSNWASPLVLDSVANLSFLKHFGNVSRGVIHFENGLFFISTIVLFLFANVAAVERWKRG